MIVYAIARLSDQDLTTVATAVAAEHCDGP